MYELVYDDEPVSFLNKLPHNLKKRIFEKIRLTKTAPFHYFERLEGRKDYKLRIGDYRVIADINRNLKKIEVTRISHRKNIYKKLSL